MDLNKEQQYKNKIATLQLEIEKLKKEKTNIIKSDTYGLKWLSIPENFEEESTNKIPILEEVKSKEIRNDDGKPTHILIEGDNYQALKCLNYTHLNAIDFIYIDPPYNTGREFVYRDARFVNEYPDGKLIDKDNPLRHSSWLSFMEKRLRLAKNLLSEKGGIYISIDDNEQANLKLLCDRIFGQNNFVTQLIWRKKTGGGQTTEHYAVEHEYILVYAKNIKSFSINYKYITIKESDFPKTINNRKANLIKLEMWGTAPYKEDRPSLYYPIKDPYGNDFYPHAPDGRDGRWRKKPENLDKNHIYWQESKGKLIPYEVEYFDELENKNKKIMPRSIIYDYIENTDATKDLISIFGYRDIFSYSKPKELILKCMFEGSKKDSVILDFFAGSGTTLHATMSLNNLDDGNRQCILIQAPEKTYEIHNGNKIPKKGCENAFNCGYNTICDITLERNKRIMEGYTSPSGKQINGLGNSLKYYKTSFIGKNNPSTATDSDCITLAKKAGYLIALTENTLTEIEFNNYYQIFTDGKKITAIYFNLDTIELPTFVEKVEKYNKVSAVYIFSWGNPDIFENEFDDLSLITIKAIPKPILEIYRSINGEL